MMALTVTLAISWLETFFCHVLLIRSQKRSKASLSEGQRLVGRHEGFTQLTSLPCCVSVVACLLGNNLDRNEVFLVSLGSRKRQMDGEPATCCSPQQGQQPAAGERADGVGGGGQRPARQETVGGTAPASITVTSVSCRVTAENKQ